MNKNFVKKKDFEFYISPDRLQEINLDDRITVVKNSLPVEIKVSKIYSIQFHRFDTIVVKLQGEYNHIALRLV